MLTASLVLLGAVLLLLALADAAVRRLPLSPALVYLATGWVAGAALQTPGTASIIRHAGPLVVVTEFALLVSLLAVGLRLRVPLRLKAWRVALLLAGPAMVVTIALATLAAVWLLGLPWPLALLLGALLAPTDPVLASDVQIRDDRDRDAVRLSLTAEGGLNDGTALPAVMLALGLLGLHDLGRAGTLWVWADLAWPIGGGALLGGMVGLLLGRALCLRIELGDPIARDELVYFGAVALAYGLARATATSAFVVSFALGATLLLPLRHERVVGHARALADRMHDFGGRCERLVEASTVLAVGLALHRLGIGLPEIGFALLFVLVLRPLSVIAVVRPRSMPTGQRALVAWFGIRGVGTLFYLVYALQHGVGGEAAQRLTAAALVCVAVSVVLHGISATPLMDAYQRGRAGWRRR